MRMTDTNAPRPAPSASLGPETLVAAPVNVAGYEDMLDMLDIGDEV